LLDNDESNTINPYGQNLVAGEAVPLGRDSQRDFEG